MKKPSILWTGATLRPDETSPLLKGTSRNVALFQGSSENRKKALEIFDFREKHDQ